MTQQKWEGEYQVVTWRGRSDVFFERPQCSVKIQGNAPPIPMSYAPKLDAVFDGTCTQTIRRGLKYAVGERRWIYEWSGKPYRSKWGRRMLVEITDVQRVELNELTLDFTTDTGATVFTCGWAQEDARRLAADDHIDPPTGLGLRDVLKGLNSNASRATKG